MTPTMRVEIFRDNQWSVRGEGPAPNGVTLEAIRRECIRYAVASPHRIYLDGVLVAEAEPGK